MTVGILGLGLIGGSLARAYAKAGHTVLVSEINESMFEFAQLTGAVHGALSKETISECDLILLAIFADGSCAWLEENGSLIRSDTLVIDCCGINEDGQFWTI